MDAPELVTALETAPVSTPIIRIWAAVTTAPCSSTTRPVTDAMETACAYTAGVFSSATKVSSTLAILNVFLDMTKPKPPLANQAKIIHQPPSSSNACLTSLLTSLKTGRTGECCPG